MSLEQDIETLANKIKSQQLRPTQREGIEAKLILKLKNVKGFGKVDEISSVGTYEQNPNNPYDPIIFFEVYSAALADFCDQAKNIDNTTGEQMTFLKRFNIYYKKRIPDIKREAMNEGSYMGTAEKAKCIRKLLNDLLQEYGGKSVSSSYYVFDKEKIGKLLMEQQVPAERILQFLADMDKINASSLFIEDEEGGIMVTPEAAKKENQENRAKEAAAELLLELAEYCEEAEDISPLLKRYIRYRFTSQYAEFKDSINHQLALALEDHIDSSYLEYYLSYPTEEKTNEIDILAAFLKQQYNTVRKQMNNAERAIQKASSKLKYRLQA